MRNMHGTFYHDRREVRTRKSLTNFRQQYSDHKVWVPAIPSWEKEFCQTIGLFKTWENFLEAKRETIRSPGEIIDWDDSAAKNAFDHAKNAFFAKKFNIDLPNHAANYTIPGPDSYIDEIKWDDDGASPDNELELSRAASDDDDDDEKEDGYDHPAIDLNMIKPTGWIDDNDQVYFSSGKVLAGLVIGY